MQSRNPRLSSIVGILCFCGHAASQTQPQALITQVVDESVSVKLAGNVHPLAANATSSSTPADFSLPMQHMVLSLKGSAAQEAALDQLLAAQNDPKSPRYHQYLTPQAFASQFGASAADISKVSAWLEGHGFKVEQVPAGNRTLIFSGNAAQVASAFRTEIRQYQVAGVSHYANASDPSIPAAFAGVVNGVVKMHDFRHTSNISTRSLAAGSLNSTPQYTSGSTHYLTPADYYTIYDINPLLRTNINGTGQSIAVIARSDIYLSDVQNFRSTFGLKANDPQFIVTNSDPGVLSGDSVETTLDTEWSGAVAPNATVKVIISSSGTSDGVDLSSVYAVNNNVAPIITLSYGSCEAGMGSSELSFYNSLWKQAATQGQSVMVSSGDSGAAGCDYGTDVAYYGQNINGLCSSPYATCVGGTEFVDSTNPGQYWLGANSPTYGSAINYIPETVWNESGSVSGGSGLWAGGGGASITYAKPSWQSGPGVPADNKRDVPDVALTAASHDGYFIAYGGGWGTVAGTSAAAPSFAGMVALVDQKMSARQGLVNATLYPLAVNQASGGAGVFHDIKTGNNSVPGVTGFSANAGYDLATGLGSVDANLLVNHWSDSTAVGTLSLTASASLVTAIAGSSAQTVTITSTASSSLKAAVTMTATAPTGVTATLASANIASPGSGTDVLAVSAASSLAAGTYYVTVTGTGGGQTSSVIIAVVVPTPSFTISSTVTSLSVVTGASGSVNISVIAQNGFNSAVALSASGLPSGVTATFAPASITSSIASALKFTVSASAAASNSTVTITGTSGTLRSVTTVSLIVIASALSLSPSVTSLTMPVSSSSSLTLTTTQTALSSTVSFSVTGLPNGVTAAFAPATLSASGTTILKLATASVVAAGTYPVTISATGGGLIKTATVTLVINAVPSCVVASSPASLTLKAGLSGTLQLSCGSPSGTFNGPLAVTVTGAPAGMTTQLSSTTLVPGSALGVSVSTAASLVGGTYNLALNLSGSGLTKSLMIPITVQGQNTLTLNASQMSLIVKPGATEQVTLTTAALGSFNSTVNFTVSATGGLTASLSKNSLAAPGSGSTVATITAPSTVASGNYVVQVTATGGTVNESVYLAVQVSNGPSFSFTANVSALSVAEGGTGTIVTSSGNYSGGFNGQLSVSIGGLPSGANYGVTGATTNNNMVNISYGITVAKSTPTGTYPVTITATGSGITHSVGVQLTVTK